MSQIDYDVVMWILQQRIVPNYWMSTHVESDISVLIRLRITGQLPDQIEEYKLIMLKGIFQTIRLCKGITHIVLGGDAYLSQ